MNKISNLGLIKKLINISTLCSLLFFVAISCVSTVNAYVLQGYKWPQPSTTFYVDIPGADGLWDDAFEGAMYEWGAATAFQFYIVRGEYSDPCNSSDDRNGVKFSSTDCGDAWGGTTLAITASWFVGNTITETDIVFNSNESWDVYYTSWKYSVNDFRRVAVHELGHALGLGHEDSLSLTIMGTWAGDLTTPQQDDINGVEAMYGLACSYSISPTSGSFISSGGTSSVSVTASSSTCVWTASESLSWISLSQTSGTGNRAVTITVTANTGATRSGTVTIAGKTYSISQAAVSNPIATISNPALGSILSGSSITFQWNNVGANEYYLHVGTFSGGNDLFDKSAGTSTSISVTGLPTDGRQLYVTLWTRFSVQFEDDGYNSYTYTASQAADLYYRDSDNDGYGDPDSPYVATSQLSGFVVNNTDCVDYDSNIHPGATEICGDNVDQNCDGLDTVCESDPTLAYEIQKLYIGYLGRAADKAGLDYWVNDIATGVMTMEQLRANLTNEQPEYTDIYGGLTRRELVSMIYRNLFDRDPDAEGLNYWVSGGGSTVNADQLIVAFLNAASTADQLVLDNKTTEAMDYTDNSNQ